MFGFIAETHTTCGHSQTRATLTFKQNKSNLKLLQQIQLHVFGSICVFGRLEEIRLNTTEKKRFSPKFNSQDAE